MKTYVLVAYFSDYLFGDTPKILGVFLNKEYADQAAAHVKEKEKGCDRYSYMAFAYADIEEHDANEIKEEEYQRSWVEREN